MWDIPNPLYPLFQAKLKLFNRACKSGSNCRLKCARLFQLFEKKLEMLFKIFKYKFHTFWCEMWDIPNPLDPCKSGSNCRLKCARLNLLLTSHSFMKSVRAVSTLVNSQI